jgi:hypothetical protein
MALLLIGPFAAMGFGPRYVERPMTIEATTRAMSSTELIMDLNTGEIWPPAQIVVPSQDQIAIAEDMGQAVAPVPPAQIYEITPPTAITEAPVMEAPTMEGAEDGAAVMAAPRQTFQSAGQVQTRTRR